MKRKKSIKIATVYTKAPFEEIKIYTMEMIRWLKISEAIARKGYSVDVIINNGKEIKQVTHNLRYVSYAKVNWLDYDIVKTTFHLGFKSLIEEGIAQHPFIISKLGSVVASRERQGVHFHGEAREKLFSIQKEINHRSKYISILTDSSKRLWNREFSKENNILLVPTGVDKNIPLPRKNPFKKFKEKIAVYIGNLYSKEYQRDVNLRWQCRLNNIGRILKRKDIRLCLVASGEVDRIDQANVTYLGSVENKAIWDYQYYADVGIVLAQGAQQHNESSKIYYYLRAGLPVVSESPIPNNSLLKESCLGFVSEYDDDEMMADLVEKAVCKNWDKSAAVNYILRNHTWDKRADIYDQIIKKEFNVL